ncbi:MAG: hypothetical protein WBP45_15780, partial [Daejeonella sp.]
LGTTSVPVYLAGFVLALLGAITGLLLKARTRNKWNAKTPARFSLKFLIRDNIMRLFTGFLITFLAFRFTNELIGLQLTMWLAFLIGLLNDQIAGIIRNIELSARK